MRKAVLILYFSVLGYYILGQETDSLPVRWGNAFYFNLSVGESTEFLGKNIRLISMENNGCLVDVDGVRENLIVARRTLPVIVNGIRMFVADNRNVEKLTTDETSPHVHDAMTKDALFCLSDPSKLLLDSGKFTFPVDRSDGFEWTKAENSHMWAYLKPTRSHEGIDINLHRARGQEIDAIVSIEDGIVHWKTDVNSNESCLYIESISSPGIYYIYQHLNRKTVSLKEGDRVRKGQFLAYIWGDGKWGHLHFAVKGKEGVTDYKNRYTALLNCFPQLYELWYGDLEPHTPVRTTGHYHFAKPYWLYGNEQGLNGYDEILGYGWDLGSWCTAYTVETSAAEKENSPDQSAVLRKTIHKSTGMPATNPNNFYDFEVKVPDSDYCVNVNVGNMYGLTWQRIEIEGVDAGVYELDAGELKWTGEKRVKVSDGKLTVRVYLKDDVTEAGIFEVYFTIAG